MQQADMCEATPPAKPKMALGFKLGLALGIAGIGAWIGDLFWTGQKQFEEVEARIEAALPKDTRRTAVSPLEERARIVLRVSVGGSESGNEQAFVFRIDGDATTYALPRGWTVRNEESETRRAEFDAVFARLLSVVHEKIRQFGVPTDEVKGEVVSMAADDNSVPPGIVVSALNVFLEAGMSDIVFDDGIMQVPASESEGQGSR